MTYEPDNELLADLYEEIKNICEEKGVRLWQVYKWKEKEELLEAIYNDDNYEEEYGNEHDEERIEEIYKIYQDEIQFYEDKLAEKEIEAIGLAIDKYINKHERMD